MGTMAPMVESSLDGVEPVSLLANLKAWPVQQSSNKLHFAYFCISIIVQFSIFRISADDRASWGAVYANHRPGQLVISN